MFMLTSGANRTAGANDMGKERERAPERRGFDDDRHSPRPNSRGMNSPERGRRDSAGSPTDATVKWFNSVKGFGFVELADGSGDAFLHIGVVQAAGHDDLAPETKLRIQVGQGPKGRQ